MAPIINRDVNDNLKFLHVWFKIFPLIKIGTPTPWKSCSEKGYKFHLCYKKKYHMFKIRVGTTFSS